MNPALTPSAFEPRGKRPPPFRWPALRLWSIRQAGLMERLYYMLEAVFVRLGPAMARVGFSRLERPVAALEGAVKGALFDCRMCGQCVLSATGMSCPMNCPKNLRNGPCGGVRGDGKCEVYPEMPCVWVQAYEGSRRMTRGEHIRDVQPAIDHRLKGASSWLRVVRERTEART
jgi:hypothetical protein